MKRSRIISWAGTICLIFAIYTLPVAKSYAAFQPNDLTIIEFKMTGSESVVIENTASTSLNLQNYLVEYFNKSSSINFNVPTDSQQLPSFTLQPGQSFLLSGDTVATCGAAGESNLSMSLSDTNGYFEAVKVSASGSSITYTPQDYVSWTSSSAPVPPASDGIDLHAVGSTSGTINSANSVYYRQLTDGSWHRYGIDSTSCNLFVTINQSSDITYVQWAMGEEAPAVILSSAGDNSSVGGLPTADVGLAAPQITELLPNPAPPATDDEDEFIELYNSNSAAFDLSGFKLEVGTSTVHDYTLPTGTSIAAKSFEAFYSGDTGLSMSNSGGQAKLIDPLGNVVSQSDAYGSAKDGQSWALANGKWYWTTSPTPNAVNVVGQASSSSSKSSSFKSSGSGSVKSSSTSAGSSNLSSSSSDNSLPTTPLHPWTLAGVGAAALLYAGYEYRADLSNNLYKLRRYIAARRTAGK